MKGYSGRILILRPILARIWNTEECLVIAWPALIQLFKDRRIFSLPAINLSIVFVKPSIVEQGLQAYLRDMCIGLNSL